MHTIDGVQVGSILNSPEEEEPEAESDAAATKSAAKAAEAPKAKPSS
jgi:hypothetical protein